ncbi:hypothetical protein evm_008414, partial [Chilo suppressalis]
AKQDFTDYGCLVVAVLTHGGDNGQLYAKDKLYNEMDIFQSFSAHKVPTLATKPKIFIIQACRGFGDPTGVQVWNTPVTSVGVMSNKIMLGKELEDREPEIYSLPVDSDMIILHSSHVGRPSFRNTFEGSWFIQSLCKQINLYWDKLDFESILIRVKREVAIEYTHKQFDRRTESVESLKQMPVITSTLIRKLYFKKYIKVDKYLNDKAVFQGGKTETIETPKNLNHEECSCLQYQQHFEYMKQCLKYYLEDHPDDNLGQCIYKICQEFKGPAFNGPKKAMINVIIKLLKDKNYENLKYIYTK